MKKLLRLFAFGLLIIYSPAPSYSHQIVGEVTPLLSRMEIIVRLIEVGDIELAFRETELIVEDFHYHKLTSVEDGLETTMNKIDKKFGTNLRTSLDESLIKKNPDDLRKTLQTLGVLLMLEKFDTLQETFKTNDSDSDTQKTIFWLGRNNFTLLLEPTLAKYDPAEEMQMDRLLDRMLYRLEDRKWKEFEDTKIELITELERYFKLSLPPCALDASINKD